MNRMQTKLMTWAAALCLLVVCAAPAPAKLRSGSPVYVSVSAAREDGKTPTQNSPSKAASGVTPSSEEIAAAKASGKVWVNLDSGVYHKRGRWYGKTKNGKFMTPDEAKKAGYRQAKRE